MKDKDRKKKYDYDSMEEDLKEAHKDSRARKDNAGSYGTIFKDDLEVPKWKPGKGEHLIDIIPYVAGKFDPNRPEGKNAYFLDIYVHKRIGAGNDQFVCPSRNYKKRCPICEEMKRLADKGVEWDEYKSDAATRMNIYNIVDLEDRETIKKGVQVWAIANYFMEDKLRAISKNRKTGEPIYYASPKAETGRSIAFEIKKKGKDKTEYLGHSFEKRDEDIPADVLDQAVCLDEVIIQSSFEEIYEAYWGKPYNKKNDRGKRAVDEEEEDDEPSDRKKKHYSSDDEDEKPKHKKHGDDEECPKKGGTFGEDCDEFKECKRCELWDDCSTKHDELEEGEKSDKKKDKDKEEEITLAELADMTTKELKKLIKEKDLDVDPDDCDDEEELVEAIADELGISKKKKSRKTDDD